MYIPIQILEPLVSHCTGRDRGDPVKSGRAKINRAKINKQALGATAPPFKLHLHAIIYTTTINIT